MPNTMKEGFLYKRGDVLKDWRARYFVLEVLPEPRLCYYRALETGEGPAGELPLDGARVQAAGMVGTRLYRLNLEVAGGKRYHLAANTQQDRREWLDALSAAIVQRSSAGASSSSEAAVAAAAALDGFNTPPRQAMRRTTTDMNSLPQAPATHPQLKKSGSMGSTSASSRGGRAGSGSWPAAAPATMPQLGKKRSLMSMLSAVKDVIIGTSPSENASWVSEDTEDSSTGPTGYSAGLRPLNRRTTAKLLVESAAAGDAALPSEALTEQFDRAQQYVERNVEEFSQEQQDSLEGWRSVAARCKQSNPAASLAAAAMYVLEVTRTNDEWGSWSAGDTTFVSPEAMVTEVQRWPSRHTLDYLKECLAYSNTSWVALFCRLGGAGLLLEALELHREGAQDGTSEAHDAVLGVLQCLHALTSSGPGMETLMQTGDALQHLMALLDPDDSDASRLVVEMLTTLCLFSDRGYCSVLQIPLPVWRTPTTASTPATGLIKGHQQQLHICSRGQHTQQRRLPAGPVAGQRGRPRRQTDIVVGAHLESPDAAGSSAPESAAGAATPSGLPGFSAATQSQAAVPLQGSMLRGGEAQQDEKPGKADSHTEAVHITAAAEAAGLQAAGVKSQSQTPQNMSSQPAQAASKAHLPDFCTQLLSLLTVNRYSGIDMDLCAHVVMFINQVLVAPEACHESDVRCLAVRRQFVNILLETGLLKVVTELQDTVEDNLFGDLEYMRDAIRHVIAPPKSPVKPSPATAAAPPAPPPAPPKAPPPPPPGLKRAPPPLMNPLKPRVPVGPKPSKKMKSFFWDKLPDARIDGTFWEGHGPAYSDMPTAEVEELFQALQRQRGPRKGVGPRRKLAVLELKRAENIGIRMSRLRVPWQQVEQAIIRLDPAVFHSLEDVETVLQCVPTEDEQKLLQSYVQSGGKAEALSTAELFCLDLMKGGTAEVLSTAEVFCLDLMKVPRVLQRLTTFAARFETSTQLGDAEAVLRQHLAAQAELRASPCFAAALQLALAIGNFMNWGTRLGQAAGFRLKNLPKLQDTRSLDGKMNLLLYIAHQLSARQPPHAILAEEVPHVMGTGIKTTLQDIAETADRVQAAMQSIKLELKRSALSVTVKLRVQPGQPAPALPADPLGLGQGQGAVEDCVVLDILSDNYMDTMSSMLKEGEAQLKALRRLQRQAQDSFAHLVSFFGENPQALASDADFWSEVSLFVQRFSSCQRQLRKQKLAPVMSSPERHPLDGDSVPVPSSPYASNQLQRVTRAGLAKPGSHNMVVAHRQRAVGTQQSPAGPQALPAEPAVQQPLVAAVNGHQGGAQSSQSPAMVAASANGVVAGLPAGTAHERRSSRLDELVAEHHDHMQHQNQQADTHRNAVDKLLLEASSDED
eukprot:jgi/Astpho2/2244/fgenesh1_pg.00040_%23_71_t